MIILWKEIDCEGGAIESPHENEQRWAKMLHIAFKYARLIFFFFQIVHIWKRRKGKHIASIVIMDTNCIPLSPPPPPSHHSMCIYHNHNNRVIYVPVCCIRRTLLLHLISVSVCFEQWRGIACMCVEWDFLHSEFISCFFSHFYDTSGFYGGTTLSGIEF